MGFDCAHIAAIWVAFRVSRRRAACASLAAVTADVDTTITACYAEMQPQRYDDLILNLAAKQILQAISGQMSHSGVCVLVGRSGDGRNRRWTEAALRPELSVDLRTKECTGVPTGGQNQQ